MGGVQTKKGRRGAPVLTVGWPGGSDPSYGRAGGQFRLQAGHPLLEFGKLLAGAGQYFLLHFEFLPGDQIELGEAAGKQGFRVLLDVLGGAAGEQFGYFGTEFVEDLGVGHGGIPLGWGES